MKIRVESNDNLPLNKTLKFHDLTIVFTSVVIEDDKYYHQLFLDECLCEL